MTSHLTPETVADLQEGLLDARETMAAQAHLLDCRRCAALRDDLAAVSTELGAAPAVGEMPPEVADRLERALAAETPATAHTGPDVTPLTRRDRTPVGMRLLQAAAVLVLLLAGVGVAVSALQGGGDQDTAATSGGADDAGSGQAAAEAEDTGTYPVMASGRNWSADAVEAAVPELVSGAFPPEPAGTARERTDGGTDGGTEVYADDDARRLSRGKALADCVTALNDGPVTPLAVDLASWQGSPAAVVVLPTAGDATTVDVWVVGPGCGPTDATVRYFARVARP